MAVHYLQGKPINSRNVFRVAAPGPNRARELCGCTVITVRRDDTRLSARRRQTGFGFLEVVIF